MENTGGAPTPDGKAGKGLGNGKKDGDGNRKKGKKPKMTSDGHTVCFRLNGDKGCSQRNCQLKHVCNVVMPNGAICGCSHSRKNHDPANHGTPKQQ